MKSIWKERVTAAGVIAIIIFTLVGTLYTVRLGYATTASQNILANVVVTSTCTLGLSNTGINFGSQLPGSGGSPTNAVFDANNGNLQGYIWLFGANWILIGAVTPNFYVTNTIFSNAASQTGAGYLFNSLTIPSANSGILAVNSVPGGATNGNNVFFGVNIPSGQTAGSYSQNIEVINTC